MIPRGPPSLREGPHSAFIGIRHQPRGGALPARLSMAHKDEKRPLAYAAIDAQPAGPGGIEQEKAADDRHVLHEMVHLVGVLRRIGNLPESVRDEGRYGREQREQQRGVARAESEEHAKRPEEFDASREHRDRVSPDGNAVTGQIPGKSVETHQFVKSPIEKDRRHEHAAQQQYRLAAYRPAPGEIRPEPASAHIRHSRSPYPDRGGPIGYEPGGTAAIICLV